ncbi:hypothetical protein DJ564_20110 [Pseudomonas sp. 31-12]|nr:hypothetical protein DJ564_20110 [Pseudomonas sp. 31-12]
MLGVRLSIDRYWPILLKKSAMVYASEKYASEIENFTFCRGFRTRISRSSVQKRRFHHSMIRQFGQTDFFNSIGRFLPVATSSNRYLSSETNRQPTLQAPAFVRGRASRKTWFSRPKEVSTNERPT